MDGVRSGSHSGDSRQAALRAASGRALSTIRGHVSGVRGGEDASWSPGLACARGFLPRRLPRSALAAVWGLEPAGVLTAVVLGQHGTRLARPEGHGALAHLAADQRKAGNGHREPAGVRGAHRTRSCQTSAHDQLSAVGRTARYAA